MKVLKNARLIDGTGAGAVKDATIVIDGNRIAAIGTQNQGDFPAEAEIIDCAGMTVLPGLIDCHDHMANHKYDLAHRWGIDEPHSTRHLRTAAVLRQTLEAGYTLIRDAGGLDAGFKRAIDEGLDDRPAAADFAGDHLADRRHRRPGQPVRRSAAASPATRCCRAGWSRPSPMSARWCAGWCGPAPTSSNARPPAAPARGRGTGRATAPSISTRCGAGRGGAGARPPGHVPRARRPRARHRDRGRGQLDRARLLSRRGPAPPRPDGGARHRLRADPAGLRIPPQIAAAACQGAGAAPAKAARAGDPQGARRRGQDRRRHRCRRPRPPGQCRRARLPGATPG